MKNWIGRRVTILCNDKLHSRVKGTLRKWDEHNEWLVLGPHDLKLPFGEVCTIRLLPEGKNAPDAVPHSVGYIMKDIRQFDNAVLFGSEVMIWRKDRLEAYRATLSSHNAETVTLSDGRTFRKAECTCVVRSLRGML